MPSLAANDDVFQQDGVAAAEEEAEFESDDAYEFESGCCGSSRSPPTPPPIPARPSYRRGGRRSASVHVLAVGQSDASKARA